MIMEHQKMINLLDNTPNQAIKFRTKNLVEINDESRGTYNTNNFNVKVKFMLLRQCIYTCL